MNFLFSGPQNAPCLLLAHGSGAPMDTDFMTALAEGIAKHGIRVARFEFAYMAGRRTTGKKPPPPKAEKLIAEFETAMTEVKAPRLYIGGKSLGGRVASMMADDMHAAGKIAGLVCLGYPFHPPGKPENLRTAHLEQLTCPALIAQGERDPFGRREEIASYALSSAISFHWATAGNHDLTAPKSAGVTREENWQSAAEAVARFIQSDSGQ